MFFLRIPHDNPVGCPGPVMSGEAFIVLIDRSQSPKKNGPGGLDRDRLPAEEGVVGGAGNLK
jgi:hypothetical protein